MNHEVLARAYRIARHAEADTKRQLSPYELEGIKYFVEMVELASSTLDMVEEGKIKVVVARGIKARNCKNMDVLFRKLKFSRS